MDEEVAAALESESSGLELELELELVSWDVACTVPTLSFKPVS